MATFKVLISDSLDQSAIDFLKKNPAFEVTYKTKMTPEELVKEIPAYHAIIIRSATKVTRPVIEAGKNLKVIARAGVGLDNVDQVAAKEKGIAVRNTPTCTTISVAELAFGLMLSVARKMGRANISMKGQEWDKKSFEGAELYGKTLGLIGTGRIAQAVATRAVAFGMKVIGYRRSSTESPIPEIVMVTKDELLAKSDFISLHIPFAKEAGPALGAAEFAKVKKGVFLINCARGGTVDEKALLEALNNGTVAAAGIDVWEKEPTANFDLVKHQNVIALPHLGASTAEGQSRAGQDVVEVVINELSKTH
ncbi:MAG TPA: hydroxyacid dehydrogenase [Candidatus Ozemobacteraceae bacterium]|nr:hydroxyacid dehydrogenase [Candidatus Ozemobacteraceae bacterium]HOT28822.1 hydroxyacid dehydrogenase [Candidatus Ozemobacteraceae bacterium]